MSGGMPHTPSGGGNIAPPISACPSERMSMKALRSNASAMARRRFWIIERRRAAVDDQSRRKVRRPHFADRLRHLALDVLEKRDSQREVREGHIDRARPHRAPAPG